MALDVLPWKRAIIENVTPQVDGGRFAAKSVVGDAVVVEADAFTDGHDRMRVRLTWHYEDGDNGRGADGRGADGRGADGRNGVDAGEVEMTALGNDRWRAPFTVSRLGRYRYGVMAWVDAFHTWRHDFNRREDPADIVVALQSGAQLIREAAARASVDDAERLKVLAARLAPDGDRHASGGDGRGTLGDERRSDFDDRHELARSEELGALMDRYPDLRQVARLEQELTIVVEPVRARYGAWYEFFPRSAAAEPGRHGTFADCIAWLPRIAAMGFDVVYFPPIHPIGRVRRKGPNNSLTPGPDDPGSPWAIGADEGGHRAIHRQLGTEADFRDLVRKARDLGLEIALDIAFQCAPDHPYVKDHPDWFRWRPDGTVQYAENPPKKYQDIYPFEFENADWKALFDEMKGVVLHWIDCGVTVFRVDNPHTKPFAMWEWLITDVRRTHPEAIFLSEAFTRPRVMHRLAKLGFSQSYTYFTWRNTRAELTEYLTELHHHRSRDYFRPNLWPNTPDILPEALQLGGRPASIARLILAATMGANYGIYGPAFELVETTPREPGSEEYLDSEKYQLRHRDLDAPHSLAPLITRVNAIRRSNPALQRDWNLRFHPVDNDQIICYSRTDEASGNVVLCAVNLDPHHVQSGWLDLPIAALGVSDQASVQVHELLSDQRFIWSGERHFLQLDPSRSPAQVFRPRKRVRSEHDFDYFL